MSLQPGQRLGVYEVLAAIGAGGMGEVYRARDTKLHRDVALKILPEVFASDPQRIARFEREAQVLAALNHPHIAHLHSLEQAMPSPGQPPIQFLVMELVEGETLAERIERSALGSGRSALGQATSTGGERSGQGPKPKAQSPKPSAEACQSTRPCGSRTRSPRRSRPRTRRASSIGTSSRPT